MDLKTERERKKKERVIDRMNACRDIARMEGLFGHPAHMRAIALFSHGDVELNGDQKYPEKLTIHRLIPGRVAG